MPKEIPITTVYLESPIAVEHKLLTVGDLRRAIEWIEDHAPLALVTSETDYDHDFFHVRREKVRTLGLRLLAEGQYWFDTPSKAQNRPVSPIFCIGTCSLDVESHRLPDEIAEEVDEEADVAAL